MYHSIDLMPRSTVMLSMHVPPSRFSNQMFILKKLGYKGLSIKELIPYLKGDKKGKVVGITFDDGYKNNLINAAPILLKNNFSATCYIVHNSIGSTNTWDLDKKITQSQLMSETQVKEWINLGMDIGAHTNTHPDLTQLSESRAKQEIYECKSKLEDKFKITVTDFCYPFGKFDKSLCKMVEEAGYLSATSMLRGRVDDESNVFCLPRIPVNYHTLPHLFLAKLLTNYEDRR
jgi:peptidoglycan/xylan/chitin deacetylase (PgdA/CDA1 family)